MHPQSSSWQWCWCMNTRGGERKKKKFPLPTAEFFGAFSQWASEWHRAEIESFVVKSVQLWRPDRGRGKVSACFIFKISCCCSLVSILEKKKKKKKSPVLWAQKPFYVRPWMKSLLDEWHRVFHPFNILHKGQSSHRKRRSAGRWVLCGSEEALTGARK